MEAAILKGVFGLLGGMILFFMKNHHDKIKSLEAENSKLKDMINEILKENNKNNSATKDALYAYCGSTKKDLQKEFDSLKESFELKMKSAITELENSIDSKSMSQIKAIDRRFSDISEETSKISEIQKQLQANTTDIEWLKKQER